MNTTSSFVTFAGYLLNGQRLIEFSTNEDRVSGKDLRVRAAVLWIKIELRSNYRKFRRKNFAASPDRSLTLWVFRVMEPYAPSNSTVLADKVILFTFFFVNSYHDIVHRC